MPTKSPLSRNVQGAFLVLFGDNESILLEEVFGRKERFS